MSEWEPIESAPKDFKKMFVVKAFDVQPRKGAPLYTSDPCCVWSEGDEFIRWVHDFLPTHWMHLPEAP